MTFLVAHSGTLVANTATTVSFPQYIPTFRIVNTSGPSGELIYVRTDGQTPSVAGDDCFVVVPWGDGLVIPNMTYNQEPSNQNVLPGIVQLISSGTPTFTVQEGP